MMQGGTGGQMAPYDDLLDTLACQGRQLDGAVWDDLVDRLAAHDVMHLAGGSADAGRPSPYRMPADVNLRGCRPRKRRMGRRCSTRYSIWSRGGCGWSSTWTAGRTWHGTLCARCRTHEW